jgi:hypothetical protein
MLRRRDMNSGAERDRCNLLKHQQGRKVFNISVNAASGTPMQQARAHVFAISLPSSACATMLNIVRTSYPSVAHARALMWSEPPCLPPCSSAL